MLLKFIFKCENVEFDPVNYLIDEEMLVINDDLIGLLSKELIKLPEFNLESIKYLEMIFDDNIEIIKVMDLSYSFQLMFYGSTKNIVSWFDIKCKNIAINNYEIGRLNIRGGNVALYNSTVKNISLVRCISVGAFDTYNINYVTSLFVDNTIIDSIDVEMDVEKLEIMRCNLKACGIFSIHKNGYLKYFKIHNLSYINCLYLNQNITTFVIDSSKIDIILAKETLQINEYNESFSTVNKVKGFKKSTFNNKSREAWHLIKMSAEVDHNQSLRAEALYNLHDLEFDEYNVLYKWLFKNIMGYGYKPIRLIRTIVLMIIGFGIIYSIFDGINYLMLGGDINNTFSGWKLLIENVFDNIYYSGITITTTGFGDKIHPNILSKLLALIEAISGVSILSLFIFSLTKRYLEK